MNAKQKFNTLLALGAVAAGCLITLVVAHRQYHQSLETLTLSASARIEHREALQYAVYSRDETLLVSHLDELLKPEAASRAAIYEGNGKLLADRNTKDSSTSSAPRLKTVRGDQPVTQQVLAIIEDRKLSKSSGFWSMLRGKTTSLHLTIPIKTSAKAGRSNLTVADFLTLKNNKTATSQRILGYAYLEIDSKSLLRSSYPAVLEVLGIYALLALLCILATYLFTRSIQQSLGQLHVIADGIASGKSAKELAIPENSDFQPIAQALNSILKNVNSAQHEAKVGRKLMSMKVDESKSKLSEQTDELSKVTEEVRETKAKLEQTTYYDSLTDLPNRALFQEKLQTLLHSGERSENLLAVLFLNLSDFRRINDALGYSAGDLVLIEIGKRLNNCLRRSDVVSHNVDTEPQHDVARIGGDEFAIVLHNIDNPKSAGEVASRIIEHLIAPIQVSGQEVIVSPAIGIAIAPQDGSNTEEISRSAGLAMNSVKPNPKGAFLYFSRDLISVEHEGMQFEAHLRRAKELDQFSLHYQPQVDTHDGSIACVEALLRWEHPELGQVPPGNFIPVAKKIGIMEELSRWIIEQSLGQLHTFRAAGLELPRVAVNLPADELSASFVNHIRDTLLKLDMGASSIELGLSNIVLMDEDSDTFKALKNLSELGAHLSLDNFGISSTPLSHLNHYPLNELKLDRNIVRDCHLSTSKASLVRAVIAVADSLSLNLVAEGVESEGEYHFLINNGARNMQGFLFSKPVPPEELRRQLEIPWFYMSQIQEMKLLKTSGTL